MPFKIKHPITGVILQVAESDFPSRMNWFEAKKTCENLEKGWRLPSIKELDVIYEQLHQMERATLKGTHIIGAVRKLMWITHCAFFSVPSRYEVQTAIRTTWAMCGRFALCRNYSAI
jgi:hypothetical protein